MSTWLLSSLYHPPLLSSSVHPPLLFSFSLPPSAPHFILLATFIFPQPFEDLMVTLTHLHNQVANLSSSSPSSSVHLLPPFPFRGNLSPPPPPLLLMPPPSPSCLSLPSSTCSPRHSISSTCSLIYQVDIEEEELFDAIASIKVRPPALPRLPHSRPCRSPRRSLPLCSRPRR